MAKKTLVIVILHDHEGEELFTSIGKIDVKNADEALAKSESWIALKKKECECKAGDNCSVQVRGAYTGLKSTF